MRDLYSVRRLLLTIVLSQVLVIQGLLLAWSGSLAIAGSQRGEFGAICYGAVSVKHSPDETRWPLKQGPHHDCLSACLMSHTEAGLTDNSLSLAIPTVYARFLVGEETTLAAILREPVFLARAPPPMLT
jgi:hypothetical protein